MVSARTVFMGNARPEPAPVTPARSDPLGRLVDWKPWPFENLSLIGRCAIAFPGGWVIHGIPIFKGRNGLSVGVPNAAQLDSEGRAKIRDGKKQYTAIITFEHNGGRDLRRKMVLGVLIDAGIGRP